MYRTNKTERMVTHDTQMHTVKRKYKLETNNMEKMSVSSCEKSQTFQAKLFCVCETLR